MKLTHFFIEHPRFAIVLNMFIVLAGLATMLTLPIAQYPNIVPPTIKVTTLYPGASADVIARTVATPLEQAINGVEGMEYISSQSTGNGQLTITVIFKIGSDADTDLLLTPNPRSKYALAPAARGSASRRAGKEDNRRPSVGRARLFARWLSFSRIPFELHDSHPRRDRSPSRCRGLSTVRRSAIRHAYLDRSGQGSCLQHQRDRDSRCASRTECPDLRRRVKSAAGIHQGGLSAQHRSAGPSQHTRAVRGRDCENGRPRTNYPNSRHRPCRAGFCRLQLTGVCGQISGRPLVCRSDTRRKRC